MSPFENPYFEEVAGGVTVGSDRFDWTDRHTETVARRDELVDEFAWAIPNEAAVETLVDHAPLLEVGAGRGYWAWCVRQAADENGTIVATEPDPRWDEEWTLPILGLDATDAIAEFSDGRTLFLCWPPYADPMAADALDAYGGDTVIYVGEGRGGCTGDDRFHELLHTGWGLVETVAIPTYLGIHDRLEVWER